MNFGTSKNISEINSLTTVGFGSATQFAFDVNSKIYIVIEPDSSKSYRIPEFSFNIVLQKYDTGGFDAPPEIQVEKPKTVAAAETEAILQGGEVRLAAGNVRNLQVGLHGMTAAFVFAALIITSMQCCACKARGKNTVTV